MTFVAMTKQRFKENQSVWFLFSVIFLLQKISVYAWLVSSSNDSYRSNSKRTTPITVLSAQCDDIEIIHGPWSSKRFGETKSWGKKPLLLKAAFLSSAAESEAFSSPLPTWEEILDLACCMENDHENNEDMVEAINCRLIQHIPSNMGSFKLEFGPFDDKEKINNVLQKNNDSQASTLVVNDVDRWIPDLSDWMDTTFDFLPRWRRDDAQVSLAACGGGIGPHVDNYDVFLIQSAGNRKWEVGLKPITLQEEYDNLIETSQVRILNMTELSIKTITLELDAGDCLYLPPRFIHCGTSTSDDCTTLSVGCRAPSASELLSKLAEHVSSSVSDAAVRRFADEHMSFDPKSPKTLSGSVQLDMKRLLLDLVKEVTENESQFDELVGKLVTEPNRRVIDYPISLNEMDPDWKLELGLWGDPEKTLENVIAGFGVLRRAEGVSFAWSLTSDRKIGRLYAQGRAFSITNHGEPLESCTERLLDRIANGAPITSNWLQLEFHISDVSSLPLMIKTFLSELVNDGFLYGDPVESE